MSNETDPKKKDGLITLSCITVSCGATSSSYLSPVRVVIVTFIASGILYNYWDTSLNVCTVISALRKSKDEKSIKIMFYDPLKMFTRPEIVHICE